MLRPFELIFELSWKYLVQHQFLLITRELSHFKFPMIRTLLPKLPSLIFFIWNFIKTTMISLLSWEQWLSCLQSLTHGIPSLPLFFLLIHPSLILLAMLYILLFKQNSLDGLTLLILLTILVFHIRINLLSGKRTSSNNSSCKMRILLSSKKGKKSNNIYQTDETRYQNDNGSNVY